MRPTTLLFCFLILIAQMACWTREPADQSNTESTKPLSDEELANISKDSLDKLINDEITKGFREREAGLPGNQVREAGKLNPLDEGGRNQSFLPFRNQFLAAVDRKDLDYVMQYTSELVKYSFGAEGGKEGFRNFWFSDDVNTSEFWSIMSKVLRLGGTFENAEQTFFIAPYVFSTFPEGDYDAYSHAAITGQGVRLRATPSTRGKVVKTISYDIVQWSGESDKTETVDGHTYPWVQVKTLDGVEGYVYGKFVHSPIGFRAGFEFDGATWKLIFFVAGD